MPHDSTQSVGSQHGHDVTNPLGETCLDCGTHHRVLSSFPDAPFTDSRIESLRERDDVAFIAALA